MSGRRELRVWFLAARLRWQWVGKKAKRFFYPDPGAMVAGSATICM
jgi:hypothetical protein